MPSGATVPCPFCRRPVHPEATKCYHCGEQLVRRSRLERISKRVAGIIGISTALLSLFYGLKEGYFYIEQRQQQRAMFAAYMSAADHFLKLDNLEYAEASLNHAIELNPSDRQLRLRYFLLSSRNLLREADYYSAQLPDDKLDAIPDLVTSGFSLLENDFAAHDKAMLLISLARLLQYDQRWQSPAAVDELFAQAQQLAPDDAETAYWYGEWLMLQETLTDKGLALILEATQIEPDNALYVAALGRHQTRLKDYGAAFATLRRAIELGGSQQELQRIRASNEAKYSLGKALRAADAVADITGADFFGLPMNERLAITEFALQQSANDRYLNLLGARLFHKAGRDAQAEPLLRKVLGDYDERSDGRALALFADVLTANGNGDEAQQVRDIIAKQQERATYEEMFEAGLEGQHTYKIGLRVAKQNDGEGVRVLQAYGGYPFAKAGVQADDKLLEFAHRKVESLRSVWVPILEFTPGTDVPLKIRRADAELDLTVVIE